ncbi:MAG: IclR family transcriptional regulator [Comamonadaceae bacterium]|nr:MAG: IclR family transcriptional regulator [Comamonadaceae bacterium]
MSLSTPVPGDHHVQSFARGLAVIRSFSAAAPEQTISEVATATNLTRAGARRILLTLQGLGYVTVTGRAFRLTAKVLDLGFAYLTSLPMWELAEPVLQALVHQVQESSSIAVLEGSDIVYVLRIPTRKIITINLAVGSRLPAHCTSMGRVMLAALPPARLEAVIEHAQSLAPSPIDLPQLHRCLDEVRTQGWAMVDEELEPGLISLAAPVRNTQGEVIAAINLSSHRSRMSAAKMKRELLPELSRAAEDISHAIRAARR